MTEQSTTNPSRYRPFPGPLCPPWCTSKKENGPSAPGRGDAVDGWSPHRIEDSWDADEAHFYHGSERVKVGLDEEGDDVGVVVSWTQYLNPREGESVYISITAGEQIHLPAATAQSLAAALLDAAGLADQQ